MPTLAEALPALPSGMRWANKGTIRAALPSGKYRQPMLPSGTGRQPTLPSGASRRLHLVAWAGSLKISDKILVSAT